MIEKTRRFVDTPAGRVEELSREEINKRFGQGDTGSYKVKGEFTILTGKISGDSSLLYAKDCTMTVENIKDPWESIGPNVWKDKEGNMIVGPDPVKYPGILQREKTLGQRIREAIRL